MNCKIKPLSHRIIIEERQAIKEVRGIVMPDKVVDGAQLAITEGKIIDMAPNAFDWMVDADKPKIGDVVHFLKYEGIGKIYSDKYYRILMDDSVWGISKEYIELDEALI